MLKNLSKECCISLIMAPLVAGSSDPPSTTLDMAEYDGVLLLSVLGTVCSTGVVSLKAQTSPTSTTYTDLSGVTISSSAGESDKILALDVQYPPHRYLRAVTTRATTSAEVGGVVALRYGHRNLPVMQSDLANEMLSVCPST